MKTDIFKFCNSDILCLFMGVDCQSFPVNRWSRRYKLAAIRAAGQAMASEIQSE
jgi:hypothetical protein